MPYVSAAGKSKTSHDVVFLDNQGKLFVRQGGLRAWRNNNPGNVHSGEFANRHGAIGEAGGFAVFPDYATGRAALKALLQTDVYTKKTIVKAVSHYAPPKENNTEHGHIVAYQLDDGSGILSKDQAITMARAGLIAAVVVSGHNGDYLRSRPDNTRANNLDAMATELS